MTPPTVTPPAGAAGRWVRALITFSVGVTIGLAPYLGTQEIPFFDALLGLIPTALRDTTVPVSAALMGIIAVAVQWYAQQPVQRALKVLFPLTFLASVVCLGVFLWVHTDSVVRVSAEGDQRTRTFAVGQTRLPQCKCPAGESDQHCIDGLSWSEAEVASCWGDRAVRRAGLKVQFAYFGTTASFAALVAILVLRPRGRTRTRKN